MRIIIYVNPDQDLDYLDRTVRGTLKSNELMKYIHFSFMAGKTIAIELEYAEYLRVLKNNEYYLDFVQDNMTPRVP